MGREGFQRRNEFTKQMRGTCAKALRCDITPNAHKTAITADPYPHYGITSYKSVDIRKTRSGNPRQQEIEGKPQS